MQPYQIVFAIGVVPFVVGALLAGIGTTSTGLFAFYIALLIGGALIMSLAKKLKDRA